MIGIVYIPAYYVKTDYDFVYITCQDSGYMSGEPICNYAKNNYKIENNKLLVKEFGEDQDINANKILDKDENFEIKIFRHNSNTNISTELTQEEVQILQIDSKLTSQDGYEVINKNGGGGIFGSGYSQEYYLKKDNLNKKLDLKLSNDPYYYGNDNYKFLGWIQK